MNSEENIDIETFRQGRLHIFRQWRHGRVRRFSAWRRDVIGRFTQRGWSEMQAEVVTCKPIKHRWGYSDSRDAWSPLAGWMVTFKYDVGGKTYDGILVSRAEAQKHDHFLIRFNPAHPEQNNTFDSEFEWFDGFAIAAYDLFLVLIVVCLSAAGLALSRR